MQLERAHIRILKKEIDQDETEEQRELRLNWERVQSHWKNQRVRTALQHFQQFFRG